jgi:hypothetical protein
MDLMKRKSFLQLINRFSEDIDISLSSKAVGIAYAEKPSKKFVQQSSPPLYFIITLSP